MRRRRTATAAIVVVALQLVGLLGAPLAAAEPARSARLATAEDADEPRIPNSAPKAWARSCNADSLHLGHSTLALAPVLGDERTPEGGFIQPTPDSRGRFTPVIFVHGFNSKDLHTSARKGAFSHKIDLTADRIGAAPAPMRSLIGQIQGIPGATAFTYDYEPSHGRWVERDPIGPGLGRAIDCLFQASGEKVIVVAHSMGGLAARQAIGTQVDRSDRSDKVSTVVTFGTPNAGSYLASLGDAVLDSGPYKVATVARMIISACEGLTDITDPGDTCRYLPDFVGTLAGEATAAMKLGSKQLRELPPMPSAVNLVALAGRTKLAVPKVGLFAMPWETVDVDMGDLVVGTGSALGDHPDSVGDIDCRYQLNVVRGATDTIGLTFGLTSKQDVAQTPLAAFVTPCLHTKLMRSRELTTDALGAVAEDIDKRQDEHGKPPQLGIRERERQDLDGTRTPIQVVLDRSGSMSERVDSGNGTSSVVKIDAAKSAVIDLIDKADPAQELGVLTYPGGVTPDNNGCSIGQQIVPLKTLGKDPAKKAVRKITPDGGTPTAPALLHAAEVMESRGVLSGVIVLISDGESNCTDSGSVCDTADELRSRGFSLTVNTVGFDIAADSAAAEELRCIADATGGVFIPAPDAQELTDAIREATQAAVSISAEVPATMPVVVGGGSSGETAVPVTVTNDSKFVATDVRVALDFAGADGVGGAVLVTRPIRFLGNLEPGASRTVSFPVHPELSVEGETLEWRATVTSRNGAADFASGTTRITTQDPTKVAGILEGVKTPLILGDSYSSGEGAGDYLAGTDDAKRNMCHRSIHTYGRVLFPKAEIVACSGAVSSDFSNRQNSGDAGVRAQYAELLERVESSAVTGPPDAVLMTLGGNDIGFADIVEACFETPNCTAGFGVGWGYGDLTIGPAHIDVKGLGHADKLQEVRDLEPRLADVYRLVDEVLNQPNAVKKRGHEAPVVVLPYVRITPHDESAISGCQGGFSEKEIPFLNDVVDTLNAAIERAVSSVARDGRPIYFADDVVEAFQPNHTICEGTASYAVRDDVLGTIGRAATNASRKQELVHPNRQGYTAIATALSNWSSAHTLRPVRALTDEPSIDVAPDGSIRRTWRKLTRSALGPLAEAGATVVVEASGFKPGTRAVVWLESVPTPVGSVLVDKSGNVHAEVRLPEATPSGGHHLVTVGLDPSNQVRTTERSIRVVPAYTVEAIVGIVLGGLLLLLGLRRRRRTRASAVAPDLLGPHRAEMDAPPLPS